MSSLLVKMYRGFANKKLDDFSAAFHEIVRDIAGLELDRRIETSRPKYYDKAENQRAKMMIRPKNIIVIALLLTNYYFGLDR